MYKKKKIIFAVLICIAILIITTGVFFGHSIAYPFNAINAYINISQFTDDSLIYHSKYLNEHRNNNYFPYLHDGFDFESNDPNEYCFVTITVELENTGLLTMNPKYLTLKTDNDVICYLDPSLKYASFLPGSSGNVPSRFICRRNGMTDKELTDFLLDLSFYLVQYDSVFGEKQSVISLEKIYSE